MSTMENLCLFYYLLGSYSHKYIFQGIENKFNLLAVLIVLLARELEI